MYFSWWRHPDILCEFGKIYEICHTSYLSSLEVQCISLLYALIFSFEYEYYRLIKQDAQCTTNTVGGLLDHCCHGKSTKRSPCTVDLHVTVNNVQRLNASVGSLCIVFDLQNIPYCCQQNNVRSSSCKVPDIFVRFWRNKEFSDRFSWKPPIEFTGNPSGGCLADTNGQWDAQKDKRMWRK
jgi:hypothetical protein